MSNTNPLRRKKCQPCQGDSTAILSAAAARKHSAGLPGWKLTNDSKSLRKLFVMSNFKAAVEFINRIMPVAEKEDHHPDFHLTGYRQLAVELSTHSIGGLSLNDFIMAAKIEALPKKLK